MSYGDLQGLLSSRVPLIVVESRDESRVLKLLQRACRRATAAAPAPTGSGAGDMTGNLGLGYLCSNGRSRTGCDAWIRTAVLNAICRY